MCPPRIEAQRVQRKPGYSSRDSCSCQPFVTRQCRVSSSDTIAALSPPAVPRYRFSDFIVSPRKRLLVRGGRELPLIPRYFDLLVFLIERRHEAVHRREIFDRVWSDVIVSDSALSQAIRTLRRTLGEDPREPRFIRTVSRHGYQFVFAEVIEEDDGEGLPPAPIPRLIATRLQQAARLTPAQWAGASIGGGLAGMVAGGAGGLLLAAAPGSAAPLAVVPVLMMIGGGCGAIGGAGVGAGLLVGEASTRSRRDIALIAGAALGGTIVGFAIQWLTRWSLAALVGLSFETGGGLEGLIIGGAAGVGYAIAPRVRGGPAAPGGRQRLHAAALIAAFCGVGAFGVTRAGRPLVGGTLHAIAREARGSQISLAPLGRLIGEPDFGPVSQALIGTGEGAIFGVGLALGLMRRPSSRTSHETLTRP
jgi:DNA-binding winged helix-turn-helix (wHTH) protein